MNVNLKPNLNNYEQIDKSRFSRQNRGCPPCFVGQNLIPTRCANRPNVSFEGLNKVLKYRVFEDNNVRTKLIDICKKSNGVVGNIVPDWIKHIPKTEKKEKIQEIYNAFDEASTIFRNGEKIPSKLRGFYFSKIAPSKKQIKQSNKIISRAFEKVGLTVDKFELKELGSGAFGTAFKFTINNEDYVLKVYHSLDSRLDLVPFGHGNFHENARAFFLKSNTNGKNDHVQYYFGNIKSGYMVEKYVEKTDEIKRIYPLETLNLEKSDSLNNTNDKRLILDYGGLELKYPDFIISKNNIYNAKQNFLKDIKEKVKNFDNLNPTEKFRLIQKLPKVLDNSVEQKLFDKLVNYKNHSAITLKTTLAKAIFESPKNILQKIKVLNDTKNFQVKNTLALNIPRLSTKKQIEGIKILTQDNNLEIKEILAWNIDYLDAENQIEAMKILIKDKNPKIIERLKQRVLVLAIENQAEANEILNEYSLLTQPKKTLFSGFKNFFMEKVFAPYL